MGEKGSDCHSTNYIDILLTNSNYGLFEDRYLVDRGKLVLLDDTTKGKYIGKMVHFRSPMFCNYGDQVCNKCAGELYYKIGIKNVGLIMNLVGGAIVKPLAPAA